MVRRLVQDQNVDSGINQFCQRESSLLSAGEVADMFKNVVANEKKLCQECSQLAAGGRGWRHPPQLHNDFVAFVEIVELLRVITNFDFTAPAKLACERRDFAQNCFQKRRLA